MYIDDQLNFSENAQYLFRNGIQSILFLRLLNHMKVDNQIMPLFYRSIVESVMSYCIISWFGNDFPCELCAQNSGDMSRIIKVSIVVKAYVVMTHSLRNTVIYRR